MCVTETRFDSSRRRSSLKEVVDFMQDKLTNYDEVLKACKEIEHVGEDGRSFNLFVKKTQLHRIFISFPNPIS